MIERESERLSIREITAHDVEKVLPVHLSNPDFLQQMEGSEGEAGRYDLQRWQRDWQIAQMMPGRHTLACYLKKTGEAVGYVEYLEEHDDGAPWIGVLTIHRAHQRQGLGTEAFQHLIAHFRAEYGWSRLRAGVLEHNEAGLGFARHLGFQPIRQLSTRTSGGMQHFIIFELPLSM
ncbi:MAG TPA: GNAT family N-acetyltransferase [Ktedonobacteraceae bacterium]|nr:GNAT family N-acetyltransferase [Ktedonobacteraceae bacterium]